MKFSHKTKNLEILSNAPLNILKVIENYVTTNSENFNRNVLKNILFLFLFVCFL